MPRPKRAWGGVHLSPGQASYVLDRLMGDRRISAGEVNRYVSEMHHEIAELEQRLTALREASGVAHRAPAPAPRAAAPAAAAPAKARRRRRRRSPITAEQLASRQLQGRYLGLIRQIPKNKRAQYQKTAKDKGREAAIREMKVALKK